MALIGGIARAYSDEKTRTAEAMVRDYAYQAMRGRQILQGPVHLSLVLNICRPPSWSKRQIAEHTIPTGKPDLDNCVKLIGDALNGVVWKDDSQIACLRAWRQFADAESTEILIRPMPIDPALAMAA